MNNKHHLHRDVLNEGGPEEFEQAVLGETIRAARRFRRTRTLQRSAAVVALIGTFIALQFLPRKEQIISSAPETAGGSGTVVASHTVLRSTPFEGVTRTEPLSAKQTFLSSTQSIAILRTSESNPPELTPLTDEQLLSFFPGRSVALVGRGTARAEFILLDEIETNEN